MNKLQRVKSTGIDVLKGTVAALVSIVGLIVGGMVTSVLHMPAPVMPAYMNPATVMPLMFLSGILMAVVLGECFQVLYRSFWQRLLSLWLCHYLLYYALNTLDALLFTTMANLGTSFVSNLFAALFAAAAIACLWRPDLCKAVEPRSVTAYFSSRRPGDWAWRFIVAWLIFPPLYYLVGRGAAIFTLPYYQNPGLNLGLVLNFTLEGLMAMQVLRGALFLVAVLPILVAWKGTRSTLGLAVGSVIFIQIAIQTILQAYWLPFVAVRIPHGLELLVDSFAQAGVYAWVLLPGLSATPAQVRRQAPAAM